MFNKITGTIKLLIGILILIVDMVVLLQDIDLTNNIAQTVGTIIGVIFLFLFGIYFIYSGWTSLRNISIAYSIVLAGLAVLSMISLIFFVTFFSKNTIVPKSMSVFVVIISLFTGIHDLIRLRLQKGPSKGKHTRQ